MTKTNIKSCQLFTIAQISKLWQKQTLGERERGGVSTYSVKLNPVELSPVGVLQGRARLQETPRI